MNAPETAKKPTILIVDDSPADTRLLQMVLADVCPGASVSVVHDGQEAMDFLSTCNRTDWPDMVLLDLYLGAVTGFDVLTFCREHPELCPIPVIGMTGSDSPQDVVKAYKMGVNAILPKSDLVALTKAMKSVIGFKAGHVMWRSRAQKPAPSRLAAS